jgi:hypothetical protein
MRRFLPHLWAGLGLLSAVLTCSCQHNRCCCSSQSSAPAAATMAPSFASAARPAPAVAAPVQAKAASLPVGPSPAPIFHTTAKLSPAEAERPQDPPPSLNNSSEESQAPVTERFAHDAKYRWLVGILDYSQIQGAWLLRYVSYEEDDRYGGCVTLVGSIPASVLKKGKTVRVEGSLINPDSRQLRPAFQVENIRAAGS